MSETKSGMYEAIGKATHCYIGRAECGCVVAVSTEIPGYPKENAKGVAELIVSSLTVERMTFEAYRANVKLGCKCKKPS